MTISKHVLLLSIAGILISASQVSQGQSSHRHRQRHLARYAERSDEDAEPQYVTVDRRKVMLLNTRRARKAGPRKDAELVASRMTDIALAFARVDPPLDVS